MHVANGCIGDISEGFPSGNGGIKGTVAAENLMQIWIY